MFLSLYSLLLSIPIVFALLLFARYRRLHFVPGPLLASFTDLWRAYQQNFGVFNNTLQQLHDTYGPLVRLGPNSVSVNDPAAVSTIYSMHGEFKKADSYAPLRILANGKVQGSIIDMQDEELITLLRRAVGSAFALKNVLDYEKGVQATAAMLFKKISQSHSVDLWDLLMRFQIDFLMSMAFSENPDYLNNGRDVFSMGFYRRFTHWLQWQAMPTLEHLIFKPPVLGRFMRSGPVPAWVEIANQKLFSRLAAGKDSSGKHADLLQKYIDASDQHKDRVKPEMLQRMVASTISAGFDTTAFTMTTMIYYLLKNPRSLTTLQQELEEATARGQLSNPPTYAEAEKLRYLTAVMKEAMRCYPVLNMLLERVVPPGGATIAGTWLPAGTVVGCNPTLIHRNRSWFGDDADVFRPERWLTDDTERMIAMERAFLGFGSGKRICLGRHIAELEVKTVIPALLLRFKAGLVDPQTTLEPIDNMTSVFKPIRVTFEERFQDVYRDK